MPKLLDLRNNNLQSLDALTYITIRSFNNTEKGYAWPPYEKIMERSGLGRTFLSQSIKRLANAKLIEIRHSVKEGICNRYYFGEPKSFECIPYTIFQADLTAYEKAMLLLLKQFFVQGCHMTHLTINDFANALGLSYQQVYKPFKVLIAKGYTDDDVFKKNSNSQVHWKSFTNKLNWNFHEVLGIPVIDVTAFLNREEKPENKSCNLLVA